MNGNNASHLVIKICGITSCVDAVAAVEAGADMLGFNFYRPSPRYISPSACRQVIAALVEMQVQAQFVGIFVNSPGQQIMEIMSSCGLDLAQLCGDETPETIAGLDGRGYKALRVLDELQLASSVRKYPARSVPPAYLVDSYHAGSFGGTGQTADWSLAAQLGRQFPILLAGGLHPENVAQAVAEVQPWGVDVASGVESSPGIKDIAKMRNFITQARLQPKRLNQAVQVLPAAPGG